MMENINLAGAMEYHNMEYHNMGYSLLCEDGNVKEINKEMLTCCQGIN